MDSFFLSDYSNLEEYSKDLLKEAVKTTKKSSSLPLSGDEFEYYSSFTGFKIFSSRVGSRINKLIGKLLRFEQVPVTWLSCDHDVQSTREEIEEQFEVLVEANDILLEKVGTLLDETSNPKQKEMSDVSTIQVGETQIASWNKKKDVFNTQHLKSTNIPRPQAKFKDMIDNSSSQFIPILYSKPNQIESLPEVFHKLQAPTSLQALIENAKEWTKSNERCVHPYLYEIQQFEPPPNQLTIIEPQMANSLEDTPLVMISSFEQLQELVTELLTVSEIAVDLEAHSYRSFQGFVCLMQVSTRKSDYIIDTLELRQHMQCLNVVFTDPNIVKVMHGADWDITWLQRDFGIYVVNLFDTGQASRVLDLPRYSLAFLLNFCCSIQVDKQYQLADWRIRPLPPDMVKYAREDTHYLLYIYDRMRNELLRRSNSQNNVLYSVINRSKEICTKTYEKPIYKKHDYLKLCKKFRKPLNVQQLHCLNLLYEWRDHLARQEDESVGYVLPNHMLFQISENLPREPQGILACCNPVPTLLRQQLNEVHRLIQRAREFSDTDQGTSQHSMDVSSEIYENTMESFHFSDIKQTTSGPPVVAATPTVLAVGDVCKHTPRHTKSNLDRSQMKFTNLMSMFMPVHSISGDDLTKRTNVSKPMSSVVLAIDDTSHDHDVVLSTKPQKRKRALRDKVEEKSKKPCPPSDDKFTPFQYSAVKFSSVTDSPKCGIKIFSQSDSTDTKSSQRSKVKLKSNKSSTSTRKQRNTQSQQNWPKKD